MIQEEASLAGEPYPNRQLIVISHSSTVDASEHVSRTVANGTNGNWTHLALNAVKNTFQSAKSDPLRTYLIGVPTELGLQVFKAWRNDRQEAALVRPISPQQAEKLLFPPGHPRPGIVYVGHPFISTVYFPMAEFHKKMLEHKWNEAIHLLESLGATKIRAEYVSGAAREFAANAFVSAANSGASTSFDGSVASKSSTSLVFSGEYTGEKEPRIPDKLCWFPHETSWQRVADGRIKSGTIRFSMEMTYLNDFGVTADIKAKLTKAGFGLGGKFKDHESSVWKLEGEFRPLG